MTSGTITPELHGQPVGFAVRVYTGARGMADKWIVRSTLFGYPLDLGGFRATAEQAEGDLRSFASQLCDVERPWAWALELAPASYGALERELPAHAPSGSRVNL